MSTEPSDIIKKINNESVLRDAFALAIRDRNRSHSIYAPAVVEEIFSRRIDNHPVITDPELVTLYQTTQNDELKRLIAHDVTSHRLHLAPQIGLENHVNYEGQEALFADRQRSLQEFNKVKQDPKWKTFFPKDLAEAIIQFKNRFETLQQFLLKKKDFKHQTAEIGLCLIAGYPDVPHYGLSSEKDYAVVTRMDDSTHTTGLQLFMFLMNICEKRKIESIEAAVKPEAWKFFTQQYGGKLWSDFSSDWKIQQYFDGCHITLRDTLANTIAYMKGDTQNTKENHFYDALEKCGHICTLPMKRYAQEYRDKNIDEEEFYAEAYSNIVEVLFMLQRGHNQKFNDSEENNRPRCPVGLWDDLIREIGFATGYDTLANIQQIEECNMIQ